MVCFPLATTCRLPAAAKTTVYVDTWSVQVPSLAAAQMQVPEQEQIRSALTVGYCGLRWRSQEQEVAIEVWWKVQSNVVAHVQSRTQAAKFVERQEGLCVAEKARFPTAPTNRGSARPPICKILTHALRHRASADLNPSTKGLLGYHQPARVCCHLSVPSIASLHIALTTSHTTIRQALLFRPSQLLFATVAFLHCMLLHSPLMKT